MKHKEPSNLYWTIWYLAVFAFLVLQIVFFAWLSHYFK